MSSVTKNHFEVHANDLNWRKLDYKRIAAIACVIITHVLILGAIMQPVKPMDRQTNFVDDASVVFESAPLPPPPPKPEPKVVDIKPKSDPKIAPVIAPTAAPTLAPPVQVAMATLPSELQGDVGPQTFVEPVPELSGPPVEQTMGLVKAPPPPYVNPRAEGTLKFRVLVNVEGRAMDIVLMQSTGDRRLDRSTLSHVKRKWLFQPATVDGQAIETWGRGSVTFKMEG